MRGRKFSPRELSLLCKQLAMVLKAGMTLQEGIGLLQEDLKDGHMKKVMAQLEEELDAFKPLHEALEVTGLFPKHMLHMLKVGFISGKLEEVLSSLDAYYEREYVLKERIKQAIFHPMLLVALFMVVLGVMIVKVLPIFNTIFLGLGSQMSGFAVGLMSLGSLLMKYFIIIVIGIVILVGVTYWIIKSGKITLADSRRMAMAQFTSAMALMLSSGMNMEEAFKEAAEVVNNKKVAKLIESCVQEIDHATPLIEVLNEKQFLGKWHMRLLVMAYKTGTMEEAMNKIAVNYEDEYVDWIEKWLNRIEPFFVILFSGLIGGVLISVMFPLMNIMSSIG